MKLKTLSIMLLGMILSSQSWGAMERKERILKDQSQETVLTLDLSTVRCSAVGYGLEELKISVPALEWLAIFDHSNRGESVPCMTSGACRPGNLPVDLISSEAQEKVILHLVLKEVVNLNHQDQSCTRSLEEQVDTVVRGKNFTHFRSKGIGSLEFSECLSFQ